MESLVLAETDRSSTRLVALVVAFVIVGMVGLAIRSTGSEPAGSTGSATLTIGGTSYAFTPTACTVTATDFLAAGSGQIAGQDFWVSVSPEAAEVALGTADESTRSEDSNDLWLMNESRVDWTAEGDRVDAVLTMRDERMPDAPLQRGSFVADCMS